METLAGGEQEVWLEDHATWRYSKDKFAEVRQQWDDLGAPTAIMPRAGLQRLYVDLMGVQQSVFMLYDHPKNVESYLESLHRSHLRLIAVINSSPIDIVNFGDNVHSGTLSPELFERYVPPIYQERCDLLHSGGKFVHAHWDGDTRPLLRYARQTGLDGIEAITPKPQGDVSIEEVKDALGDMFLIDGSAAILFHPEYPLDELLQQASRVIELFAPRLILGISDEISATGEIDRLRAVGDLVDQYNAHPL